MINWKNICANNCISGMFKGTEKYYRHAIARKCHILEALLMPLKLFSGF